MQVHPKVVLKLKKRGGWRWVGSPSCAECDDGE